MIIGVNKTFTSLSTAVPVIVSLTRLLSASGGRAEGVEEEGEGGEREGGPTGSAHPPTAEQGELCV